MTRLTTDDVAHLKPGHALCLISTDPARTVRYRALVVRRGWRGSVILKRVGARTTVRLRTDGSTSNGFEAYATGPELYWLRPPAPEKSSRWT